MKFIDLQHQYLAYRPEIDARMRGVIEHAQFIMGPEIQELEDVLAARVRVAHAITTANGTASLEMALRALEIGRGDEVITPPFTWISTAEVVRLVGATPVFVDIEERGFNIDPGLLDAAINRKTKAIIAVNLFGQMANYRQISEIAGHRNVPVIEDAAQSFGATQNGQQSGSVTKIGCTSFFPAKPFGCFGDGGAIFTNDDALAERIRAIRIHGATNHEHRYIGTNGRFDTLQAAVLLAKLGHFDDELRARQRVATRYAEALSEICRIPLIIDGNTHTYAQYTIRVVGREQIQQAARDGGVPTVVYYPRCIHEQPAFADLGYVHGDFPVSERAAKEVMSLPLHPFLTMDDQHQVIDVLRSAIVAVGRPQFSGQVHE